MNETRWKYVEKNESRLNNNRLSQLFVEKPEWNQIKSAIKCGIDGCADVSPFCELTCHY